MNSKSNKKIENVEESITIAKESIVNVKKIKNIIKKKLNLKI